MLLFEDFVWYWFETYRKPQESYTTAQTNERLIRIHILPFLGQMQIEDIRTADVQKLLNHCLTCGNCSCLKSVNTRGTALSTNSVTKIRQIVCACFNRAVTEGLVIRNFAAETVPIKIKAKRKTIPFTRDEKINFLNTTCKHRYFIIYLFLFATGCRRSEILGLSWRNVDFAKNTIHICQGLILQDGQPFLHLGTKTEQSDRNIPIPTKLMELLKKWKEQTLAEKEVAIQNGFEYKNDNDLVFVDKLGRCVKPNNFSRNFKDVIKNHNFPKDLHIHSIRHTWATDLIQKGVPIVDIQFLGGWSRPDTLLRVYAHELKETQVTAINELFDDMSKDLVQKF